MSRPHAILYHPAATDELEAGARYYESQVEGLGFRFLGAVADAEEQIARHPESGTSTVAKCRKKVLRTFPFSLVYQVRADRIVIFAVAPDKRRPGYWRERLPS